MGLNNPQTLQIETPGDESEFADSDFELSDVPSDFSPQIFEEMASVTSSRASITDHRK